MAACYADLDSHVALLSSGGKSEDLLCVCFAGLVGMATKRRILDDNPMLSRRTVERVLQKLQVEGIIERVGAARATARRRVNGQRTAVDEGWRERHFDDFGVHQNV